MDALSTEGSVRALMEYLAGRKAEGSEAQHAWARAFYTADYGPEVRAVGFKVKDSDLADPTGFGVLLRRLNVRVVHMTRDNTVKAVLSMINSFRIHEKTGLWTVWKDEDRPGPMRIAGSELEALVKIRQRQEERLSGYVSSLGLPTLRISYEQLYSGLGGVIDRLNLFLGTSISAEIGGRARTKKVTSNDLRSSLTNFDELAERFAGTEIGRMLGEGVG